EYVAAFLLEAQLEKAGLSFFIGVACRPLASIRRLSFEKPVYLDRLFCYQYIVPMGLINHLN
ncbi:hypothetical protein, partial [Flavobacterium sp. UBA6195]|uniref:hypothetical protein n=1 Tax=Flavobacterium sp. UBA6195 TaxID=1946554 RepID=UPI0025C65206